MRNMVIYKGFKFVNLGLGQWRVRTPHNSFTFRIQLKNIAEIRERVDLWRSVIDEYYRA